jgi:hypothetical protein
MQSMACLLPHTNCITQETTICTTVASMLTKRNTNGNKQKTNNRKIRNGMLGVKNPIVIGPATLQGYICDRHRQYLIKANKNDKPIVLFIEFKWGYTFDMLYEAAILNSTYEGNIRFISFRPNTFEDFGRLFQSEQLLIDDQLINVKRIRYVFLLCHGNDQSEIGLGDDNNHYNITLDYITQHMARCFTNLLWLHVGACQTLNNYKTQQRFIITGFTESVTSVCSAIHDVSALLHAFHTTRTNIGPISTRGIAEGLNNHLVVTKVGDEDLGFVLINAL